MSSVLCGARRLALVVVVLLALVVSGCGCPPGFEQVGEQINEVRDKAGNVVSRETVPVCRDRLWK